MPKFAVIIPAAGKAERFGGSQKKTFAKIGGRPMIIRSVECFINRDDVCQTILAVAPEDVAAVKSNYGPTLGFMGVKLVEGGPQRCDTVRAALDVLVEQAQFVAVHDAARPCVTAKMIDDVFAEAVKTGAAILAAPICGTIKRVSEAKVVEETVPRTSLFEAQTPQVFQKDILLRAYQELNDQATDPTDDAQVVETAGHPVSVVPSDPTNLKVTSRADMALANAILKSRPSKPIPKMGAFEEAQW